MRRRRRAAEPATAIVGREAERRRRVAGLDVAEGVLLGDDHAEGDPEAVEDGGAVV